MSSSSLFIITSREDSSFKRRFVLGEKSKYIRLNDKSGNQVEIELKMLDGKPVWSTDGKKFKSRFSTSPINLEQITYPKTEIKSLSKKDFDNTKTSLHYFIVDRRTDQVLASKIVEKKKTFSSAQALKEFGVSFDKNIHKFKIQPVSDNSEISYEHDNYGNDYFELLSDRKVRIFSSLLLSLWLFGHGLGFIMEFFNTEEVTKVQLDNSKKVAKEREKIAKLLNSTKPVEVIASADNKALKSKGASKKKSRIKKAYSVKKKTNKKLAKGKNTVAATKKSLSKPKSKPSLQDQLFSRSLVKGSTGRASSKASNTLRGNARGKADGKNYARAGTIKGGFAKGKGSSFGTKLGNRGGSGGGNSTTGGNGIGGLGAGLTLNGNSAGVSGGLTREQINKIVRRNKKDISRCFETREQFSPGLAGQVSMNFTINSSGAVTSASAGSSSISDRALKNCLSRKISNWRFDKPTGGSTVKVSYPFNFKSTQGKF